MEKCLNCDTEFTGNYCNNCGQKKIEERLTVKVIFSDFIQSVFLFDSSLYKTLLGLLVKPGDLVTSFLKGKRDTYRPPFQFFLLFITIYLLVLNFFGDTFFEYINRGLHLESDNTSIDKLVESLVRKNLNILYFILIPINAFVIHLFYKKIKFNFAELLIFSLYIVGIMFFISSLVIILGQIDNRIFAVKHLITLGYFTFAIMQFTNSKSLLGILKALFTVMLNYLIFALITLALVNLYVYIFITN